MFSHFPAMTLAKKAVTVTVICGAVAVGTGGAAFATTRRPPASPAVPGPQRR